MNLYGLYTLFSKEVWRFLRVSTQTLGAPAITALLFLVVFAQAMETRVTVLEGISYQVFLVPGLIMMSMIQNAFANSSSSLLQSKMNGSLVFLLLAPLSAIELYLAYVSAAIVRGFLVGMVIYVVAWLFIDIGIAHLLWVLLFAVFSSAVLGALGLMVGVLATRIEQVAGFQNFIILPMSFLSGVFYSIYSLPPFWQAVSKINPFFYMVDGFRYSFFQQSDVSPGLSLLWVFVFFTLLSAASLHILKHGYKMRN